MAPGGWKSQRGEAGKGGNGHLTMLNAENTIPMSLNERSAGRQARIRDGKSLFNFFFEICRNAIIYPYETKRILATWASPPWRR